jgi:4-amino-4-deoxy-L-arabinose transferase-like glycosyltransferase
MGRGAGGDPIPNAAGYLNALLGGLTTLAVYLAASAVWSGGPALVAAAVVALDPSQVLYSTMLLSEPLAAALVTGAVAAVLGGTPVLGGVTAGLFLGWAALTRESIAGWIPLFALAVWRLHGPKPAVALAVVGCLAILPWTVRNLATNGPILISSRTGYNLLVGNNPFADGTQRGGKRIFLGDNPPVPETLPAVERHFKGSAYALAWIKANPGRFIRKGWLGALRMFGLEQQFPYSLREGYYARSGGRLGKLVLPAASMGPWLLMLPLALLGLYVAPAELRTLGIAAVVWLVALGWIVFGEWRFRYPTLPLFALLAVAGGHALLEHRIARPAWLLAVAVMVPVAVGWVLEVLSKAQDAGR